MTGSPAADRVLGAAILGSATFLVVAPGVVAGIVPWWISGCWPVTVLRSQPWQFARA